MSRSGYIDDDYDPLAHTRQRTEGDDMSRFEAMYPACGPDCNCGMLCKRSTAIDEHYASRLAFMLECMMVDGNGHWNAAAVLLDEYKAEHEKINPSPPTFMGEPMPPDRRERLQKRLASRHQ